MTFNIRPLRNPMRSTFLCHILCYALLLSAHFAPTIHAARLSNQYYMTSDSDQTDREKYDDAKIKELLTELQHYMHRSRQHNAALHDSDDLGIQQEDQISKLKRDNSRSEKASADYGQPFKDRPLNDEIPLSVQMIKTAPTPVTLPTVAQPDKETVAALYGQLGPEEGKSQQAAVGKFEPVLTEKVGQENRNKPLKFSVMTPVDSVQRPFTTDKNLVSGDTSSQTGCNLYEMLLGIDGRLQKVQDSLLYYRSMSKFGMHSGGITQACPNYLSLIKSQFLTIENTIETKFSNLEHKLSNIEIEDGIWKKTINWKVEEMASKLSQTENKISFSSEQIMNKLDLIERNFKVVSNDFFAKFLLVNEKLNKIELNLQAKLSEFESKMRKNLDYQHKLTNIFKQDFDQSVSDTLFPTPTVDTMAMPNASGDVSSTSNTKKPPVPIEINNPSNPVTKTWIDMPTLPMYQRFNGTINKTDFDLNKYTQRFLKLVSLKHVQNGLNRTKLNGTALLETIITAAVATPSTIDPNTLENDAPHAEVSTVTNVATGPDKAIGENVKLDKGVGTMHQSVGNKTSSAKLNNRNIDAVVLTNSGESALLHRNTSASLAKPSEVVKDSIHLEEEYAKCEKVLRQLHSLKFPNEDPQLVSSLCRRIYKDKREAGNTPESNTAADVPSTVEENKVDADRDAVEKKRIEDELAELKVTTNSNIVNNNNNNNNKNKETVGDKNGGVNQNESNVNSGGKVNPNGLSTSKLEELDRKLQFFSTKIIKIVQEMWLSSQASESYLKETLNVANKTNFAMKEEFVKLQNNIKGSLNGITEEIRDPILTQLKEMSSAINNSVAVILNTQAQYINSFQMLREEDGQVYEVLGLFLNEVQNKSVQFTRLFHEHNVQLNQSFGEILNNIEHVGQNTIEGVKVETRQLMKLVKDELYHIKAKQPLVNSIEEHELSNPKSLSQTHCNNECFISKREFANICLNIEDKTMLGGAETAKAAEPMPIKAKTVNLGYFDSTDNATNIEINNGNHDSEERSRRKFKRAVATFMQNIDNSKLNNDN